MSVYAYVRKNLARILFPDYSRIDCNQIKVVETKHGRFNFSKALRSYYNVFEQIDGYDISDLTKDDIVIDIGANVGIFTTLVAPKVKHVVAIEPLFMYELQENVELNQLTNVTFLNFALGNRAKSDERESLEFDGFFKTVHYKTYRALLTISSIEENTEIKPTVIKTDCEGGEWALKPEDFEGVRAVEAEVHNFGGKDPKDFLKMLESLGFKCNWYWTPDKQMMIHARRELNADN